MQLKTLGRAGVGMTLGELRDFVAMTEGWSADVYLDCRIPTDDPEKSALAPLMGLEAADEINCPRCGTPLNGEQVMFPISRVDNTTRICNPCGNAEAMYNYLHPERDLPPVTESVAERCS